MIPSYRRYTTATRYNGPVVGINWPGFISPAAEKRTRVHRRTFRGSRDNSTGKIGELWLRQYGVPRILGNFMEAVDL